MRNQAARRGLAHQRRNRPTKQEHQEPPHANDFRCRATLPLATHKALPALTRRLTSQVRPHSTVNPRCSTPPGTTCHLRFAHLSGATTVVTDLAASRNPPGLPPSKGDHIHAPCGDHGPPDPVTGQLPVIRHACDESSCCRPGHWLAGSHAENAADYAARGHVTGSPLTDRRGGEPPSLEPGEAYQRCLQALGPPHPDYEQALVYAVLSLDETLRSAVGELGAVAGQIRLASRRR